MKVWWPRGLGKSERYFSSRCSLCSDINDSEAKWREHSRHGRRPGVGGRLSLKKIKIISHARRIHYMEFQTRVTNTWSFKQLDPVMEVWNQFETVLQTRDKLKVINTWVSHCTLDYSSCDSVVDPKSRGLTIGMFSQKPNSSYSFHCMVIYWFLGFRKPDNQQKPAKPEEVQRQFTNGQFCTLQNSPLPAVLVSAS